MKQRHATATASALFALLPLSLLLFRLLVLLVRLRLAAFRDAALSLHFLARLRIRPVHLRLPGTDATTVRVWCPAAPSAKPPLLLLHGFGGDSKWTWARNLPALSRHFHVYAPDLLFFGAHSRSASPLRTVAFQARCAAEAMRLLGVDRYDVVGISYGGVGPVVIASSDLLKTAADDRGFLKRAGDGWSGVEEVLLPAEPAAMRKLLEMASCRPPPPVLMPDFILRDFIQKLFTENREQLIQLFKGITVGTDKFPVTPMSQEVLIVWGEQDQLFPVEKAYAVQSSLDGKARVEIISKTGHAPQLEDPTRFNKILLDFLLATHKPDPSSNGASQ
uniref:AB hydrolase-1 domain-containing protein n=1 Tax=Oryza nivara TaxID=4536 RepID=A0A0E0GHM2_ORYNI